MPNYVTKMSKAGETPYEVMDKGARTLIEEMNNKIVRIGKGANNGFLSSKKLRFNTETSALTIYAPAYVIAGNYRKTIDSDITLYYGELSYNQVSVVMNLSTETISVKSFVDVDTTAEAVLFTFTRTTLKNPSTNTINVPYIVDGATYNDEGGIAYVSGSTGNDQNDGYSSTSAFKTIQKAIDSGAETILVARGSYSERLSISNKNGIKIMPMVTPSFSSSSFDVPMIVVNEVAVANCRNVYFKDVHANNPGANVGSWNVYNTSEIVFDHCWASNGSAGGFVCVNVDGKFILCKAWDIGDSQHPTADGFNLHGYGVTELIDCVAHDIMDDGISHHDGCVAYIHGGEFWNCENGGGIAPVNRYCEIDGVYCHDNLCGIQLFMNDPTEYDPYILVKNSVLKDNTSHDIECGAVPMRVLKCTFDTKEIDPDADYVEIN